MKTVLVEAVIIMRIFAK